MAFTGISELFFIPFTISFCSQSLFTSFNPPPFYFFFLFWPLPYLDRSKYVPRLKEMAFWSNSKSPGPSCWPMRAARALGSGIVKTFRWFGLIFFIANSLLCFSLRVSCCSHRTNLFSVSFSCSIRFSRSVCLLFSISNFG